MVNILIKNVVYRVLHSINMCLGQNEYAHYGNVSINRLQEVHYVGKYI